MFKNRRIGCKIGRTINLGDFESVRVDVETSATIDDDQDIQEAKDTLFFAIKDELEERCIEFTPKPKPKPKYVPKPTRRT